MGGRIKKGKKHDDFLEFFQNHRDDDHRREYGLSFSFHVEIDDNHIPKHKIIVLQECDGHTFAPIVWGMVFVVRGHQIVCGTE